MERPNALGPMLEYCGHLARERMNARLAGCGLTPSQTHVLMYLDRHGGCAPQCEVTEYLRVKPSTVNGILNRMEEQGLVRRSVSDRDARQRLITLLDQGRAQQERFQRAFVDTETVLARGFTPAEQETLMSLLTRVICNLEEDRNLC